MTSPAPMPIPTTLPEVAQLAVQNREDIASLTQLVGRVNDSVQQLAHQLSGVQQFGAAAVRRQDRLAQQLVSAQDQLANHLAGATTGWSTP